MYYFFELFLCIVLLSGCSTKRKAMVEQTTIRDSVVVNYVTETTYVTDTVYVEIPAMTEAKTTADSSSYLHNDFASSTARINADGTLYHDLVLLPQTIPKEIKKPVVTNTRETHKYHEKKKEAVNNIKPDVNISFMTRIFIALGKVFSILIFVFILINILKRKLRS